MYTKQISARMTLEPLVGAAMYIHGRRMDVLQLCRDQAAPGAELKRPAGGHSLQVIILRGHCCILRKRSLSVRITMNKCAKCSAKTCVRWHCTRQRDR